MATEAVMTDPSADGTPRNGAASGSTEAAGQAVTLGWREILDWLGGAGAGLRATGDPVEPLVFVDLEAGDTRPGSGQLTAVAQAVAKSHRVMVGLAEREVPAGLAPLADELACTLVHGTHSRLPVTQVAVPDLSPACRAMAGNVTASPKAAATLVDLLRLTSDMSLQDGLVAESMAYSMLLAGPEFARWRAGRPRRGPEPVPDPVVLVERIDDELRVTLNHPVRHNCFSRWIRDGLVEAFDLALLDPSIGSIRLAGRGRSFCSGGDLDEFGTATDETAAHLIRLDRSVAARASYCRDRLRAVLHGACIGAGIEIPSFAGRIEARDDAFFQLPELAMGLVPGAGGTVGITRRIGRWRTAYLALSGIRLDLDTALAWGLVDTRAGDSVQVGR
jgi:enoyl-CoA hydratase/carnithine racemase